MTAPYYADEQVTLYRADALAVLQDLPDASVDAIITDPPYSSGGRRENSRSLRTSMVRRIESVDWIVGDALSTPGFVWFMREIGLEARRVLVPGGHFLSFTDWRMCGNLSAALESADLRVHPTLVWDKVNFGMGAIFRNQHEFIVHLSNGTPVDPQRRDVPNVLRFAAIRDGEHPTQKPVPLMRALVGVVCPEGGTVLDLFMGSGTTGVAAVLERRRFIGSELMEHWSGVSERRIRAAEGQAVPNGLQDCLDLGATS